MAERPNEMADEPPSDAERARLEAESARLAAIIDENNTLLAQRSGKSRGDYG